jgi:hypothetical protein
MRLCAGHEGIAALPQVVGVSNGDLSTCDEHGGTRRNNARLQPFDITPVWRAHRGWSQSMVNAVYDINALLFLFRQLTENGAPSW